MPATIRIVHDLHCHTLISDCATRDSTLDLLVARAAAAGLTLVGVTDHLDGPDPERLAAIEALAERARSRTWPVEVRIGAEVSLLRPGAPAVTAQRLAGLDFFNLSPNHIGTLQVWGPPAWTPQAVADWLLAALAAAIEERPLAVSHPFYHGWVGRVEAEPVFAALDRGRLRRLFERAGRLRVAIELNARKVRAAPTFFREVIALAAGTGVRFTLGSDAHEPAEMGYGGPAGRQEYERLLTALGLTADLLWTPAWWVAGDGWSLPIGERRK